MNTETVLAVGGAVIGGIATGAGVVWNYFTKELKARDEKIDKMYDEFAKLKNRVGYLEGKQDTESLFKDYCSLILKKIDSLPAKPKKDLKS